MENNDLMTSSPAVGLGSDARDSLFLDALQNSISDVLNTAMLSSSMQDFGKESLGILPSDFGGESFGFLNASSLDNPFRESLLLKKCILLPEDSLDGRESLGILHLNDLDLKFGGDAEIPDITFSRHDNTVSCANSVTLNTAFLFANPREEIKPNVSFPNSENLSFNISSLEGPSKIYTISKSDNYFSTLESSSSGSVPHILNKGAIGSTLEIRTRMRIQSLPEKCFQTSVDPDLLSRSLTSKQFDNSPENDRNFCDSIFIEGKYIAHKIADGSILNDSFQEEVGNLDNIPVLNNLLSEVQNVDDQLDLDKDLENEAVTTEEAHVVLNEESLVKTDTKCAADKIDNSLNQSRNAKEILHNLSEILNSTTQSDQQKSEGHRLISTLAELFCNRTDIEKEKFYDSGHSSSIHEHSDSSHRFDQYHEVSELNRRRKLYAEKGSQSAENVLGNSYKSKSDVALTERRLSKSFYNSNNKVVKNVSSVRSNSANSGNLATGSFRLKTTTSSTVNKGPLKAVIPLKDVIKKPPSRIMATPEKSETKSEIQTMKKTSTPINEPKLKPVASSTPTLQDDKHKPYIKPRRALTSTGMRSGTNKDVPETCTNQRKANSSLPVKIRSSLPSDSLIKNKPNLAAHSLLKPLHNEQRRCSLGYTKRLEIQGRPRSNSVDSKVPTGIMSSMKKIRENLLNSPEYKQLKRKTLGESNNNNDGRSKPSNSRKLGSDIRPKNLLSGLEKANKENMVK